MKHEGCHRLSDGIDTQLSNVLREQSSHISSAMVIHAQHERHRKLFNFSRRLGRRKYLKNCPRVEHYTIVKTYVERELVCLVLALENNKNEH